MSENDYIIRPVTDGDGYRWHDLEVRASGCAAGGEGVFAARRLPVGARIPILGHIMAPPRLASADYSFELAGPDGTVQCHDGHPSLDPHGTVGVGGLAIAMKINEPPHGHRRNPNCRFVGRWVVVTTDIAAGDELFVWYGDDYRRETVGPDHSVVPYQISARVSKGTEIARTVLETIDRRVPAAARRVAYAELRRLVPPLGRRGLPSWYVAGRRTGHGYDFDIRDPPEARELSVLPVDWFENADPGLCRGLFNTRGSVVPVGTVLTTYSGPVVDQDGFTGDAHFLCTVYAKSLAIDGYRNPRSFHGMAQFANDYHGSGREANARLQKRSDGRPEVWLVATRPLQPGEEILVSIPGHFRTLIQEQASFEPNRLRSLSGGRVCVIRYNGEPHICEVIVISRKENGLALVHWFACTDDGDDETIEGLLNGTFHRMWTDGGDGDDECVVTAEACPAGMHAYTHEEFRLRTSDILAHRVELGPDGRMRDDLRDFLRHKFTRRGGRMLPHQ